MQKCKYTKAFENDWRLNLSLVIKTKSFSVTLRMRVLNMEKYWMMITGVYVQVDMQGNIRDNLK